MVAPWKNIDAARRRANLNLKEMAEKCGVSQTAVQNWKHGGSISLNTLVKLASVLNTSCDKLLSDGPPKSASGSEQTSDNPIPSTVHSVYSGEGIGSVKEETQPYSGLADHAQTHESIDRRLAELAIKLDLITRLLGCALHLPAAGTTNTEGATHEKSNKHRKH